MLKRMSLFEVRDKAVAAGRAVYSVQQLAHVVGKPKAVAKVYVSRLVKNGLAQKVWRGRISLSADDFVVATQLVEPSYVSLHSALFLHGLVQQVPAGIACVTPSTSKKVKAWRIFYHRIPPALFYGFAKQQRGESYVFVAEPEKAVIDAVYLNRIAKGLVAELKFKLNKEKLKAFVEQFHGRGRKKLEQWLL